MKAWHFLREDKRLGFDDGRRVRRNVWYIAKGPIALGHNGMHGGVRLIDALSCASGPIICRVVIKGELKKSPSKIAGRKRRVIAMADASTVLFEFACWSATKALEQQEERGVKVDARLWSAIDARRKWICGEIDDTDLLTAHSDASSAANTAASVVYSEAAYSALYSAANFSPVLAAYSVASESANSAASARSIDYLNAHLAARSKQNKYLTRSINRLLKSS